MKIKFNNIQDLSDARYAAAAMAEWIGFTVDALPIAKVQEIIGWCAGPKLILEVNSNIDFETIKSWITILPIDGIECPENMIDTIKSAYPESSQWDWIIQCSEPTKMAKENPSTTTYMHHVATPNVSVASNQDHIIFNISELLSNPDIVIENGWENISINCQKEEVVGMKNFDNLTVLFEKLDIF